MTGVGVRGGVILFRGTGTAARRYLEADRSQADEYYLEAGAARAELSVVDGSGRVIDERALTPVEYAGWVDWIDPISRESMGRARQAGDGRRGSPRFAEMVVNTPKSLSIAAALHPDVSEALDAAQRDAVAEIRSWLGKHSVTRVGRPLPDGPCPSALGGAVRSSRPSPRTPRASGRARRSLSPSRRPRRAPPARRRLPGSTRQPASDPPRGSGVRLSRSPGTGSHRHAPRPPSSRVLATIEGSIRPFRSRQGVGEISAPLSPETRARWMLGHADERVPVWLGPVSYTHLTLP